MAATDEFVAAQQRLLQRFDVDAESHFVSVAAIDGRAHVLSCGRGAPVVLVPGFADPAAMWTPLMARLGGFELHAVDRPSFGLSSGAGHRTGSIRRLAVDFLEQVLDALGLDRPVLIANSIGSLWAFWFALDRPARVGAMVHVGCPAFILGTSAPLPMRLLSTRPFGAILMKLVPPSASQVEAFARTIGGEDLSALPELRDLLVAAQRLPGAQQATRELLHALIRLRGARRAVVLDASDLHGIRQPVLLIWGGRDVFGGPEVGERAERAIPDASLHVVAEGGHVPWVGHPDEVADAVRPFLSRYGTTRSHSA